MITRPNFPFFQCWIKLITIDDSSFAKAIEAHNVLYEFMASRVSDVRPAPDFRAAGLPCLHPSATMLTPSAAGEEVIPVDIPPMYDHGPFDEAIQASHGNFTFSSDNEVLYFGNQPTANGCIANYVLPGC